ncbi:MAG: hypothetical protein QXU18_16355 [Thermoplasmatales archaeon]
MKHLKTVPPQIINTNSLVFLEASVELSDGKTQQKGFVIERGKLVDKGIGQKFGTSSDINGHKALMDSYLTELETKRTLKFGNRNITWLICGENNVLKNIQSKGNEVKFRMEDDQFLKERFDKIYQKTNIFINPTHTIMGNQGKLKMRREFLSHERVYVSTSNANSAKKQRLDYRSIQYVYQNSKQLEGDILEKCDRYMLKKYQLT